MRFQSAIGRVAHVHTEKGLRDGMFALGGCWRRHCLRGRWLGVRFADVRDLTHSWVAYGSQNRVPAIVVTRYLSWLR